MTPSLYVCPVCKGPLALTAHAYACAACACAYPLVEGIPDFYIPQAHAAEDTAWTENLVWLDPQMVAARDVIYDLSVRALKGMTFAMQQLARLTFPGCRILEVGTGTGHLTRWIAEAAAPGTQVYSFDFSWPMFAKARANIADQPGVFLSRADARGKLPFRAESFDLVFLRLAPLGELGTSSSQAAFDLLKPGGWLFKAGWELKREDAPWTEYATQMGYESAETHEWQYPRPRSVEEYAAARVECERAMAFGAPFKPLPAEPESMVMVTRENLRIAQKPIR